MQQFDSHHDVVVIGAGQAGLAMGHHLQRLGLDFVILDGVATVIWATGYRLDHSWIHVPEATDDAAYLAARIAERHARAGRTTPSLTG